MFGEVTTSKAYWDLIKKSVSPKVRQNIGPIKRDNGTLAVNNEEKSNLFNSYFATIGESLALSLPTHPTTICMQMNDSGRSSCDKICISQDNIQRYIFNINSKKSTGPDGISPRLLKLAGNAIIPSLTDLFIWSAQAEEMFESWKLARLTPIFKKDVEEDRENYRPISLLCVPSKILEEEVNNTIVKHVFEENQLMTDRQWAYHRCYSMELLLLTSFQNDFGIDGSLLAWLKSYLKLLGPTLFALFTNDLPENVESGNVYMYADDTTLYCIGDSADEVVSTLNKALSELCVVHSQPTNSTSSKK